LLCFAAAVPIAKIIKIKKLNLNLYQPAIGLLFRA
jgi:hypothetical protein